MKRWLILFVLGGVFVWLLSGVYVIGARQTGVLMRFGKVVNASVKPGLHYHLPYPFEQIVRVPTGELHSVELEFRNPYKPAVSSYLLTGDENVVRLKLTVHYRIAEPVKFVFVAKNTEMLITRAVENAAVGELSSQSVDFLLTTGKGKVAREIKMRVQRQTDKLALGVEIVSVLITELAPPVEVAASFKDVASAREDKVRRINEVEGARNRKIPTARGRASEIIEQAKAYAAEKLSDAHSRAHRFESLAKQAHRCAPCVKRSLLRQSFKRLLDKTNLVIVDAKRINRIVLPPEKSEQK